MTHASPPEPTPIRPPLPARGRRSKVCTAPTHEHDACGVGFVAHIRGHEEPRDRRAGSADPEEPRPSRRGRCRPADGRRRRRADPDPRRRVPRGDGAAGRDAAAGRRVRRRHGVPAEGACVAAGLRAGARARGARVRPGAARLARRAGRPRHADVAGRQGERAGDPADLHRSRARGDGDRRARAQALHHPQVGRARDPGAEAEARQGVLRAVDVGAHRRLQGPAARRPGRRLLQGPRRPADGVGDLPRAPALLDEHVPELGARASVPHGRAQRRDQHGQGQRQLDQRAPAGDLVAGARARPRQASGR